MPETTTTLFNALLHNQAALGAAIEELVLWVEQRGSTETGQRVRDCLKTLDDNTEVIPRP